MTPWHIGEVVDSRWKIRNFFPNSGMGVVALVERLTDGQVLVVKTFQRQKSQAQLDELCEFKKEVLLWISLGAHPHIATIYGVENIGGLPALLIKYYLGGDLSDVIAKGSLKNDLKRTLDLAIHFCEGMIHANNSGLLAHRDIKPRNCLLDTDGRLVVTDFGLGKISATERGNAIRTLAGKTSVGWFETRTGARAGTFPYMAPEQYDDLKSADRRSDVYSFGLMLYEMTTGMPAHRHPHEPLPNLETIRNGRLRSVVRQCVKQYPEERYSSFEPIRECLIEIYRKKSRRLPDKPRLRPGSDFDPDTYIKHALATALSEFGDEGAALQLFEHLARPYPQYEVAQRELANSYQRNGLYDKAIGIWKQEVDNNRKDPEAHLHYGAALALAGKARAAVSEFHSALDLRRADFFAWKGLGSALYQGKRFKAALGAYHKALEQQQSADVHQLIGLTYERMGGHLKEAAQAFRSGLRSSPGHTACAENLARILFLQGEFQDAIRELRCAVEENPDSATLNEILGDLHCVVANTDIARVYFESRRTALDDFVPGFPEQRSVIPGGVFIQATERIGCLRDAFSSATMGDIKKAIESFEDAEEDRNIDAETYREFAMIMFEYGEIHMAFHCAWRARSRDPKIQLPEVLEIVLREYPLLFDSKGGLAPEMERRFERLRADHLANKKE